MVDLLSSPLNLLKLGTLHPLGAFMKSKYEGYGLRDVVLLGLICTPKLSSSDLDNSSINQFKVLLKSVVRAVGVLSSIGI
jgi:hypothetical protein